MIIDPKIGPIQGVHPKANAPPTNRGNIKLSLKLPVWNLFSLFKKLKFNNPKKFKAKITIITLGDKGLFYSDGKEEIYLKATSVKAIDTTGAGDAFNGGLAFGLLKKKSIKETLVLANKVAGISTTKLGAGNSMPFINDLK